jgi:chemotaxis protein MotB
MSIARYRRSIDLINNQIAFLKENRAWLELKIDRIKDFNRQVPESMENSVLIKTGKIKALEKFKKRLIRNLKKLLAVSGRTFGSSAYIQTDNSYTRGNNSSVYGNNGKSVSSGRSIHADTSVRNRSNRPLVQKNNLIKEIGNKIRKAGLANWVEISLDDECCRLVTTLPILFASGSAEIAGTYRDFFKKLAKLIRNYDVRIIVNGYADIDSIHNKKYPSNFELGAARAANVVHELVKYGIKPSVFKIGTTGRYRAQAKGMSKKKVIERRADLTIIFTA